MSHPNLFIFASGGKTDGGSGFRKLIENAQAGNLRANIVGVASQYAEGGVNRIAIENSIPFHHFLPPYDATAYQRLVGSTKAEWVALSGWMKLVRGLDPTRTINIHPGPLPQFGGKGMHGIHVHRAVLKACQQCSIDHSAVCMHFVTPKFDEGPLCMYLPVLVLPADTPESLAARVNAEEHRWQSFVTDLVINGDISWDGNSDRVVKMPRWYSYSPLFDTDKNRQAYPHQDVMLEGLPR